MQQTIHWLSLKALKFVPIGEAALARSQLHPRWRRRKWRHPDQRPGYPDCLPIRDTDRGADQHLQELGGAEAGRGQEAAEPGLPVGPGRDQGDDQVNNTNSCSLNSSYKQEVRTVVHCHWLKHFRAIMPLVQTFPGCNSIGSDISERLRAIMPLAQTFLSYNAIGPNIPEL